MDLGALEAARKIVGEDPGTLIIMESMNEDDVDGHGASEHDDWFRRPRDGQQPHPRLYGTFPRVIGHYARAGGLMTLEAAIHRMTGMAAEKFHLRDRGSDSRRRVRRLVIFDAKDILDTATYTDPRRYPAGISHVFVNGAAVVRAGAHLSTRPGRAIRRAT